jgi:hypothetical protein
MRVWIDRQLVVDVVTTDFSCSNISTTPVRLTAGLTHSVAPGFIILISRCFSRCPQRVEAAASLWLTKLPRIGRFYRISIETKLEMEGNRSIPIEWSTPNSSRAPLPPDAVRPEPCYLGRHRMPFIATPSTAEVTLDAGTLAMLRSGGEYSSCECLPDRQTESAHCTAVRPAMCEAEMVSVGRKQIQPLDALLLGYDVAIEGDRPRAVWQDEIKIGLALRCRWASTSGSLSERAELPKDSFAAISIGESVGTSDAYSADGGVGFTLSAAIGSRIEVQVNARCRGSVPCTNAHAWLDRLSKQELRIEDTAKAPLRLLCVRSFSTGTRSVSRSYSHFR